MRIASPGSLVIDQKVDEITTNQAIHPVGLTIWRSAEPT